VTTQTRTAKPVTVEATAGAIFNLPYLVAAERGYFLDEGLDVDLVRGAGWAGQTGPIEIVEDHRTVSAFGNFNGFEAGASSLYRACEWGQIRRSADSQRDGRVISKRAAVASQAIIVRPDSPANIPQDLAHVPVGVSFHHGSHYIALQTLEGFLPREEIQLVGIKGLNRFLALRDGHVDAVAVMEPWITVAEKLGYKIIAEAHYVGSEIAGPDVDAETFAAINRAVSRAVVDINSDLPSHLHHFIAEVPAEVAELTAADFRLNRLRYIEPAPYPEDAFRRTYDWMVSWDLIGPDATFEDLVDNRVVATAS
jgi:NitT/TauT family transport system substrate-binding protein